MDSILLAVLFRLATEADMQGLMNVEDDSFGIERFNPQVVRAFIERENAFILVCIDGDEIVGSAMALYSEEASEGKIASIAVVRRARGRGIGTHLLEECEEIFKRHGLKRYTLEVETNNELAVALYMSRGYLTKGLIKDFYAPGRDAYCMEKRTANGGGVKVMIS
jgi:[ribosomal protein S18]-alanine N-acetyltransferase